MAHRASSVPGFSAWRARPAPVLAVTRVGVLPCSAPPLEQGLSGANIPQNCYIVKRRKGRGKGKLTFRRYMVAI